MMMKRFNKSFNFLFGVALAIIVNDEIQDGGGAVWVADVIGAAFFLFYTIGYGIIDAIEEGNKTNE